MGKMKQKKKVATLHPMWWDHQVQTAHTIVVLEGDIFAHPLSFLFLSFFCEFLRFNA